jgi:hypothetical protein
LLILVEILSIIALTFFCHCNRLIKCIIIPHILITISRLIWLDNG